jgi:hypothetical protein
MAKIMEYPQCFAILDKVFPKGENELRQTPERCMVCLYKVECLRTAMGKSEGFKVKEEMVDRAYSSGNIGFFERWSRKKDLQRRELETRKTKSKSRISNGNF